MNKSNMTIKKSSTFLLKSVIVLIAFAVLAICILVLPRLIIAELSGDFDYGPLFIGMYVPALPFFIALFQGYQLLRHIENNQIFSFASVNALRRIKMCGIAIAVSYIIGMPYIFYLADRDDAPGLAAIGFIFIFTSLAVGAASGIFQKMLQNVVDIKSENDLTI